MIQQTLTGLAGLILSSGCMYTPNDFGMFVDTQALQEPETYYQMPYEELQYGNVLIRGTEEYIFGIERALKFIQENDPESWNLVENNVTTITLHQIPYRVSFSSVLTGDIFTNYLRLGDALNASILVHESWHIKNFPYEPFCGPEGERIAYGKQKEFLDRAGVELDIDVEDLVELHERSGLWAIPIDWLFF